MHMDYVYCVQLIRNNLMRKNNAKLKKGTQIMKLSQPILIRSYCFADIMTRDNSLMQYVELGIFCNAAKIRTDKFNSFVAIVLRLIKIGKLIKNRPTSSFEIFPCNALFFTHHPILLSIPLTYHPLYNIAFPSSIFTLSSWLRHLPYPLVPFSTT